MESEKVKEIKKVLECCSTPLWTKCDNCSRADEDSLCMYRLQADALTLINELESENETIKFNMQETEKASFNTNQINGNLVIENQQLKNRVAELGKENKDYYDRLNNLQTYINNHEEVWKGNTNNALKQFAERVKMEFYYQFDEIIPSIMAGKIDKILKEFLGK